jgi:glycosyltransferase involved in cell wall biosynthesis
LVSINIPTLNSARTLEWTLRSVFDQSGLEFEVILIDNGSDDDTIDIGKKFGATILFNDRALLESRCLGINASSGVYTMLLDSDQIIRPDTLARSVNAMPGIDYLFLEEYSEPSRGHLEAVLGSDKVRVHQDAASPGASRFQQVLPRFFRSALLTSAVRQIPTEVRVGVVYRDHAVLNFEVSQLSRASGWLTKAIFHRENPDLLSYLRKQRRYGSDDHILWKNRRYRPLVAAQLASRVALSSGHKARRPVGTIALAALRAPVYLSGVAFPGGEVHHNLSRGSNRGED